jgi:hypothetical protein
MANENNNTLGITIFKVIALAGGALTGAIIANWLDKRLNNMATERSDYDKTRYAQGLAPREPAAINPPAAQNEQSRIIRVEQPDYQNWTVDETDEEH